MVVGVGIRGVSRAGGSEWEGGRAACWREEEAAAAARRVARPVAAVACSWRCVACQAASRLRRTVLTGLGASLLLAPLGALAGRRLSFGDLQGGQARLKLVIVLLCGGTRRRESAQLRGGGASIAPQCVARVRELACRPDHEPLQAHGACWLLLGRERPRGSGGRPRGRPGRAEAQRASLHRRVAEPVGCLSSLDALIRSQIHVAQVYSEFQLVLRTRQ